MQLSQSNSQRSFQWLLCLALLALTSAANANNWNYLDGPYGGQPLALFSDAAGNTWAGMNGSGAYLRAAGTTRWASRPGLPNQSNAQFTIDGAGTVYVSGSAGLYSYAPGAMTWTQVSGSNGLPNQAAGGLVTDAAGDVYAAMNQSDVYKLPAGQKIWASVGTGLPPGALASQLVIDGNGNLWAAIFGSGVYKLTAGTTTWIAMNNGITQSNVTSLALVGNDLFAGVQFGGVLLLANAASGFSTWVPWNGGALTEQDAVYAFAVGTNNMLYAAGSGAVYATPTGTTGWTKVGVGIESLGPTYSLVYSAANGTLTLGASGGTYLLPAGASTWQLAIDGMAAGTTYGIAVAPSGDIYAATFGRGVERLVAGGTTWNEVDAANSYPVVGAVTIDSHGTVFATPGGAVKKLVSDTWIVAGASQNAYAYVIATDASDTVWAGVQGGVRKLASGAASWSGTGTGLPGSKNVSALVIDAAGAAYAGIYGGGVYVLPAGGVTWTLDNAGLADFNVYVLQRDAAGAIYAGTDSGVYKLVGSAWQKFGSGPLLYVTALAFDAKGDAYAGTDADYVWRLPAGGSTWARIGLGLGSSSVQTLAVAGGRVYAGTDGSRGSPSGVFVLRLSDTVVEFYNTILDNFFITATAAEQDAILGGSAGPGWILTGNVFSAGGTSFVCRFYGSISPGPNSHFYTIDPTECQQLKDFQASTPPTQKRWNFESNDYASSPSTFGACPADSIAVYRAYNNGFTRGVDSNHRITSSHDAYLQQVARGWTGEGVVMCAPK